MREKKMKKNGQKINPPASSAASAYTYAPISIVPFCMEIA